MDVQPLELSIPIPLLPRFRRPGPQADQPAGAASPPTPDDGGVEATVARRRQAVLYAYTAATIVAGLGALLWTTLAVPIWPAIDPGLDGTALGGPDGGMLLWIAFGLIGSLRVLPLPGSAGVWTFHFPFIAAATVLGGPTAGAWVGFLATIERRELESQPWYGMLANHAVLAFAAVVGGLTVQVTRGALGAVGTEPGLASLIATAAGTISLVVIANAIAAGTIMLRENLGAASLVDMIVRGIGNMTLAEVGLAWVFVIAATAVGWWAPLVMAIGVLSVWPREGDEFVDPLMKLPRLRAFERELDGIISRTRRGLAAGGTLVWMDLDGFGDLNKKYGQDVGDEVLVEVGRRLREMIRATDFAARRGGDELAIFFANVVDRKTALRLAERVETSIRQPILTSSGVQTVGVSIGVLIIRPVPDVPNRIVLTRWVDATMQGVKTDQKLGLTDSGIRFHSYGTAPARSSGRRPRSAAGGRRTRPATGETRPATGETRPADA